MYYNIECNDEADTMFCIKLKRFDTFRDCSLFITGGEGLGHENMPFKAAGRSWVLKGI